MSDGPPTVALIHATPAAMRPARAAFADRFPEARLWNLLDDLLITEAEAAGGLTPPLRHRMRTLIRHAVDGGADAVLLSCSMYGQVAIDEATSYPVPVLPSDQALFEAVRSEITPATGRGGSPCSDRSAPASTTPLPGWLTGSVAPELRISGVVVDGVQRRRGRRPGPAGATRRR